jgi:hypothetical protein
MNPIALQKMQASLIWSQVVALYSLLAYYNQCWLDLDFYTNHWVQLFNFLLNSRPVDFRFREYS